MKRLGRREGGFTLIELLVVVGILAALAAILVPNVARFVGTGKTEGAAAELDALQAAVDSAIAEIGLTTLTASTAITTATNLSTTDIDGSAGGTLYLYPSYTRMQNVKYGPYTVAADGKVTSP